MRIAGINFAHTSLLLRHSERSGEDWSVSEQAAMAAGAAHANPDVAVIMMVGPPGSGKSTLARGLFALLQAAGGNPRWHNQDEAGGQRMNFLATIRKALADPSVTHIILDKSNLAEVNRRDYAELRVNPTVTLVFQHPDGPDALAQECIARILKRGAAHRTLQGGEEKRGLVTDVVTKFVGDGDVPTDESVAKVDVTLSAPMALRAAWTGLQAMCEKPLGDEVFETLSPGDAVQASQEYEALLLKYASTTQLFASIQFTGDADVLLALCPPAGLAGKMPRRAFHIPARYFGGEMDPAWFTRNAKKVGQKIMVTCVAAVYDDRAMAIEVEKNFECTNKVPHFTVALAAGEQPVYSNELLRKPASAVTRVDLKGVKLECAFAFQ